MKLGKEKKEKTIIDHLVDFGLDKADAEDLAIKLGKFKELPKDGIKQPGSDGDSEDFVEKDAREINIDGQSRLDMARFLLQIDPTDSIEKKIAMSEIPAPNMMHLCMSKTLDDLCGRTKEAKKKTSPIEVFITNYTTFMLGLNRKNRKEGLQIFETDSEKVQESRGMMSSLSG